MCMPDELLHNTLDLTDPPSASIPKESRMSTDRDQIIETTIRVAWYADQRRWRDLPELFAGQVLLDYSSLAGGEPTTVSHEELAASWRATLAGLDATQHVVSNHLVEIADDGTSAVATAQFIATHLLTNSQGGATWTLGGNYRWTLRHIEGRWKIDSMTMNATWATGNQQIMTLAANREHES